MAARTFVFRAAYKLNDHVRIDFGPDSLAQEYKFKLHSEKLKHLFITHSHEDHLYLNLLNYRMPRFFRWSKKTIFSTSTAIRA